MRGAPGLPKYRTEETNPNKGTRSSSWTANIHLKTRPRVKDVLADLKERKPNWLRQSAEKMVEVTLKDREMWASSLPPLVKIPVSVNPQ
jgi:hypothetical protein